MRYERRFFFKFCSASRRLFFSYFSSSCILSYVRRAAILSLLSLSLSETPSINSPPLTHIRSFLMSFVSLQINLKLRHFLPEAPVRDQAHWTGGIQSHWMALIKLRPVGVTVVRTSTVTTHIYAFKLHEEAIKFNYRG